MSQPNLGNNSIYSLLDRSGIEKTIAVIAFAQNAQSFAADRRLQWIQQNQDNLVSLLDEYENIRASFWWLSKNPKSNEDLILSYIKTMRSFLRSHGAWEERIHWLEVGESIYRNNENKIGLISILTSLGLTYDDKGEYGVAIQYYQTASLLCGEIGDQTALARIINNIGVIFQKQGQWSEALASFTESARLKANLGDQIGLAVTLGNIGIIHFHRSEWDTALVLFEHSRTIREKLNDRSGLAIVFNNIANTYHLKN